jgi:signal transduction histidine kinase
LGSLVYLRLIGFTAGTLLMLFWMVVILGYRRQRNFERVFFFLCLALFLFYAGSLLALNSQIYYTQPPPLLTTFAWTILSAGLCFAPVLLIHMHFEYALARGASTRGLIRARRLVVTVGYALTVALGVVSYKKLAAGQNFDFLLPANSFGPLFGLLLLACLAGSALWQWRFARSTTNSRERAFHRYAAAGLAVCSVLVLSLHILHFHWLPRTVAIATAALEFLPIPLFAALMYAVQKYNFLQIGRQTNLMYAVSATFLALLYLALVRRISGLLEPVLPPEATASVLLFVLVIFVEPMQRRLGRQLHESAQLRLESVRRIGLEVRDKAREGDLRELVRFIADRVRQQFEFKEAWLEVSEPDLRESVRGSSARMGAESFPVVQPGVLAAVLYVRPHGAMLSGDVQAGLELLCEQLPASMDLCRLIEEKLRLERELAERERLAALGQMAASISHNLKNPLGSIKTILQVQLENPEIPASVKTETTMVLEEISRLSAKLGQLLQFSRPTVIGQTGAGCDAAAVVKEVTDVIRHEAERRGVHLQVACNGPLLVTASREAVNDMLTNLIVNSIDAAPAASDIRVLAARDGDFALLGVEDDGKGIPTGLREKVLEPFFTTKTQGTGLGLAIVAKRVAEANGSLDLQSPITGDHGTRFAIRLPLLEEGK